MTIADRLTAVHERIASSCVAAERDPREVRLVAVSKTHPAETVTAAVAAGVTDLGENRVQEAHGKKPHVDGRATWHLIGPLQRNKAKTALELFDVLHTLDRESLATRLQALLGRHWPGRTLPVLIEVNIGSEAQKAGVLPSEALELARLIGSECPALRLDGLMAIPPFEPEGEASRPYFRELRLLRERLEQDLGAPLSHLSMGMSHDFEIAVAEGSTMVRVGTAIFGPRRPFGA